MALARCRVSRRLCTGFSAAREDVVIVGQPVSLQERVASLYIADKRLACLHRYDVVKALDRRIDLADLRKLHLALRGERLRPGALFGLFCGLLLLLRAVEDLLYLRHRCQCLLQPLRRELPVLQILLQIRSPLRAIPRLKFLRRRDGLVAVVPVYQRHALEYAAQHGLVLFALLLQRTVHGVVDFLLPLLRLLPAAFLRILVAFFGRHFPFRSVVDRLGDLLLVFAFLRVSGSRVGDALAVFALFRRGHAEKLVVFVSFHGFLLVSASALLYFLPELPAFVRRSSPRITFGLYLRS